MFQLRLTSMLASCIILLIVGVVSSNVVVDDDDGGVSSIIWSNEERKQQQRGRVLITKNEVVSYIGFAGSALLLFLLLSYVKYLCYATLT